MCNDTASIYISMIPPVLEYRDALYESMSLSTCQVLETIQRQATVIWSLSPYKIHNSLVRSRLGINGGKAKTT